MQPNASRNVRKPSSHRSFTPEVLECRTLLSAWGTVDDFQPPGQTTSGVGAMASDGAGNVYAVGSIATSTGTHGILREKLSGSATWTTIANPSLGSVLGLSSIAVDKAGDIYVGGSTSSSASPFHWVVLERPAGMSSFSVVDSYNTTGLSNTLSGLAIDGAGDVFAIGRTNTTTTTGTGTTTTQFSWTVRKQTGGHGSFATVDNYVGPNNIPSSVTAINAGPSAGIYVAGHGGSSNSWLVRKSSDGGATWSIVDSFQYAATYSSAARGIAGDNAGNIFVVGGSNSATLAHWLVRESSDGGASWSTIDDYQRTAGISAAAGGVGTDLAGNVYVVGAATDPSNVPHSIVRTNTGGSWATVDDYQLAAGKPAGSGHFTVDTSGNLYSGSGAQDAAGTGHWIVRSIAPASVAGVVFADANANGKQDPADKGIAGRKVYLDLNRNGKLDAGEPTTLTAANGTYHFGKLSPGRYQVREVLPAGWRGTAPAAGYFDVVLKAGQALTGESFGVTQAALVSGVVFKDTNNNGKQDSTETGLVSWTVYIDTNNNGKLDTGEKSISTDSKGKYSFVLKAGKYNIRTVLKSGFKRTVPAAGLYAITLGLAQIITGENFGNR